MLASRPTPEEIASKRASAIARKLKEGSHGRLGDAKAARIKAAAKSSVGVRPGQDAASFQIKTMVSQVEFLNGAIAKAEREVESLLEKLEPLVTAIPGVPVTTDAQMVAEIGDVRRFGNAAAVVKYAGLSSGVNQSGRFEAKGAPIAKHGSPCLRRSLRLAANRARQFAPSSRSSTRRRGWRESRIGSR